MRNKKDLFVSLQGLCCVVRQLQAVRDKKTLSVDEVLMVAVPLKYYTAAEEIYGTDTKTFGEYESLHTKTSTHCIRPRQRCFLCTIKSISIQICEMVLCSNTVLCIYSITELGIAKDYRIRFETRPASSPRANLHSARHS